MFWKKRRNEVEAGQVIAIPKAEVAEAVESMESREQKLAVMNADDGELVERTPRGTLMARVVTAMVVYEPKPMMKPVIDPEFKELSVLPRITEVCRILTARLLYAISPGGGLQAWWKLCFAVLCVLIPAVAVIYLTGMGLTYVLEPVEHTTLALQRIAFQLVGVAGLAAGIIILYAFCRIVLKGTGMIVRSSLFTGIFTIIILLALLAVGVAYGLGWLENQHPLIFGWLKWLLGGVFSFCCQQQKIVLHIPFV